MGEEGGVHTKWIYYILPPFTNVWGWRRIIVNILVCLLSQSLGMSQQRWIVYNVHSFIHSQIVVDILILLSFTKARYKQTIVDIFLNSTFIHKVWEWGKNSDYFKFYLHAQSLTGSDNKENTDEYFTLPPTLTMSTRERTERVQESMVTITDKEWISVNLSLSSVHMSMLNISTEASSRHPTFPAGRGRAPLVIFSAG